jgi:hypothetical protein
MVKNDIAYFHHCHQHGLIRSSFLEVGSRRVQGSVPNLCDLARELQLPHVQGVDMISGEGVDLTFDFSLTPEDFRHRWSYGTFNTVAVFNVLEHTFDPITVLHNALQCVISEGTLLVVTPVIWPLHNYPGDYVRLMPEWYVEFARRFDLEIQPNLFCWLSIFGITRIDSSKDVQQYEIPSASNIGKIQYPLRYFSSRMIHRVFNTFGRSFLFSHTAIGVTFKRFI